MVLHDLDGRACRANPASFSEAARHEGDRCRTQAKKCGMEPIVSSKSHRKEPWEYDKELYKGGNVLERNFRNIKKFRRVFTRDGKRDETYSAFIAIANIAIFMRN